MWNDFEDCDLLVAAGDLNARTKDLPDYIADIDGHVPNRINPDKIKNSHGTNFLTFLKDNRAVILNGRITPELNNYTFVSPRGTSVPDYIFVPLDHLPYCKEMKVTLVKDAIQALGLPPPQSIPDHSILSGTFTTSFFKLETFVRRPQISPHLS